MHFPGAIESTGRTVIGDDEMLSFDQLAVAATAKSRHVAVGAAERLPFPDSTFETAVSTFTHTDVPDFGALVGDVARVLRHGGVFVYVGVHPVLVHHAAERRGDGILVKPDYAVRGRVESSPVFKEGGLRARVGEYHIGLDGILMAFVDAGLRLTWSRRSRAVSVSRARPSRRCLARSCSRRARSELRPPVAARPPALPGTAIVPRGTTSVSRGRGLGPVRAPADVGAERHLEVDGVLHLLADDRGRLVGAVLGHLEDELVVHGEEHVAVELAPVSKRARRPRSSRP